MKIDYVIPMVFENDPIWKASYVSNIGEKPNPTRYRSWGTEDLLVKCIKTFMPWIDTIIILLAHESQKQPWMDTEKVRIVYHREFIPKKYLPCFNSCTIEMFLPFIPDLAEYFIYGNDDMFPISPLLKSDFFVSGKPCIDIEEKTFPEYKNTFHRKCKLQQDMIGKRFGWEGNDTWLYNGHSINAFVKSECFKCRVLFGKEIEDGITPLRSVTSFNQYIYVLWQYFSKKYVDYAPMRKYLSACDSLDKIRDVILSDNVGVVCFNDYELVRDISNHAKVIREAIEEKISIIHSDSGAA